MNKLKDVSCGAGLCSFRPATEEKVVIIVSFVPHYYNRFGDFIYFAYLALNQLLPALHRAGNLFTVYEHCSCRTLRS